MISLILLSNAKYFEILVCKGPNVNYEFNNILLLFLLWIENKLYGFRDFIRYLVLFDLSPLVQICQTRYNF